MCVGDMFNIYYGSGNKVSAIWQGDLKESLNLAADRIDEGLKLNDVFKFEPIPHECSFLC